MMPSKHHAMIATRCECVYCRACVPRKQGWANFRRSLFTGCHGTRLTLMCGVGNDTRETVVRLSVGMESVEEKSDHLLVPFQIGSAPI